MNDIPKLSKPTPRKGLDRLLYAFTYSLNGLRAAIKHEVAFRQELWLFFIFLGILFFLPVEPAIKMILFVGNTIVLIIELLNSAIEAVVDKVSPEYHELAKRAKDIASAAVLISLVSSGCIWLYAIKLAYFPNLF